MKRNFSPARLFNKRSLFVFSLIIIVISGIWCLMQTPSSPTNDEEVITYSTDQPSESKAVLVVGG